MNDTTIDKFKNYRFDLVVICTNGRTYLHLWKKIFNLFSKNKELFQLSPTFFAFARDGLLECAVSNLMKLYDVHKDSFSVYTYLNFAEQNMGILFKKKNQKNIKKEIKLDRDRLSKEKTSLGNLKIWRDKRLYHLEKEYAGDLNQVFREHTITIGQFDNLYSLAKDILNRYSIYFDEKENYMEYGMLDIEFQNLLQQLTAGKTDAIVEKLRRLSRTM
jgi:hypothetical protein